MKKANKDIRDAAKAAGINLWQLADAYGLSESGFSKRMRFEFAPDEKQKIFAIITNLKEQNKEA